jgi:DNA-binding transcriptional LysR family regulator
MEIRNLRYFLEVAHLGSFSQAAARLHRSQPALSRGIQELEADLGFRLFSREGRHVVLTPEGQAMVQRVEVLMREVETTQEYATLLASGKTAILRIGAGANNISRVMPRLLEQFGKDWAHVEVLLQSEGANALLQALERGEIDVAITRYVRSAVFEAEGAFPTNLVAVLQRQHPLAKRASLTIPDLQHERLLVAGPSYASRSLVDRLFHAHHLRPKIVLESAEFNTMVEMAKARQGVAIIPSTISAAGPQTRVIPIFHRDKPVGEWTALVWDKRRMQPAHAKAFIKLAVDDLARNYPGHELKLPVPERDATVYDLF